MNKQEILEEINKTEEHLTNMKKMLEECEYERWKPERDEVYWYVSIDGSVEQHINVNHWVDKCHFKTLNYFQTREQAEAEAEKILVRRQLEDIARRLNKGEKIDQDDSIRRKYSIIFNTRDRKFICNCNRYAITSSVYCLDENFLDVAIQEIGAERLKKYLRGE